MKHNGKIRLKAKGQALLAVILIAAAGWLVSTISCTAGSTGRTVEKAPDKERSLPAKLADTDVIPFINKLEIPKTEDPYFVVTNEEGRYTYLYDTMYRQAAWVAYVLTRGDVESQGVERSGNFVICRTIKDRGWNYSATTDYSNTRYDRGHLLPSADRNSSREENKATFLMSNVSPQTPGLNRGIWKNLEEEVRRMAVRLDTLYVVTGGELKPGLKTTGKNKVGVPERFFKVLLAKKEGRYISTGFVIPNADAFEGDFWSYSMSVDSVEGLLGYDFFHNLPDILEEEAESFSDKRMWR